MNDFKRIIDESIEAAENGNTKLNEGVFGVPGYSSRKVRTLLNEIVGRVNDPVYLEVGSFMGSTLISALYENPVKRAYAIDNWSEFNDGSVRNKFIENTDRFIKGKFDLIEGDCFDEKVWGSIPKGVNVFFFDGEHTYESHYAALIRYIDLMENDFIFIVDDFDPYNVHWANVEKGTRDSINDLCVKVNHEVHVKSEGRNSETSWWNGLYIAHITK